MGSIHPFLHYRNITSICGAVDDTWQTVDISDYVPLQAAYVLLLIKNASGASQYYFNVRPKGSNYNDEPDTGHSPRLYPSQIKYIILKLNSDYEFEIRRSNANIEVRVAGWADGAIAYLSERVDVTPSANASWEETDLSAHIPSGATGAYFYCINLLDNGRELGVRENGSTNGVFWTVHRSTKWLACGVDANRKVQLYKQDANEKIYLMGYFTAPIHFNTNRVQIPLTQNDTWHEVDASGTFSTNNIDFAFISMLPASDNIGIGPVDGSGYQLGKQRYMGFVRITNTCTLLGSSNNRLANLHYGEGYQETDTSRYQLDIDADEEDSISESNITYGSSVYGIRWLRKCFVHNGLFWVFYVKGDLASDGTLYYRTSSDGETWSSEVTVRVTSYRYGCSGQVWFDGSKVHIHVKDTPRLFYRKGTPNADGTITWDADWQTSFTPSPNPAIAGDSAQSIDSSGYPWVTWCYTTTDNYDALEVFVNGSQNNDGTWTDLSGYPKDITNGTAADNYREGYLLPLANRDMYCILAKGNAAILGRKYTQSTDTWGGVETATSTLWKQTFALGGECWCMSAVVDSLYDIHMVFTDSNNNLVYLRRDHDLGWLSESEITLKANIPDYGTPQMAIDYSNGNLYVFYAETNNHIYMLRRINGIWDAEWIDFMDMSDAGLGYESDYGIDGCLSVSRRVINNRVIILAMRNDSPRTIGFKVREIDKASFTYDGVTRQTPWKQDGILDGTNIAVVMPSTFSGSDWYQWDDGETNRSRTVTVDDDYLLIGQFQNFPPTVVSSNATNKTSSAATLNANITSVGSSSVDERGFEWGTESGVYTDSWTETGTFSTGTFSHGLTNLQSLTTYYFRAKAHNNIGWGYGSEYVITTLQASSDLKANYVFKNVRRCLECSSDMFPTMIIESGEKYIRWKCENCDNEYRDEINDDQEQL